MKNKIISIIFIAASFTIAYNFFREKPVETEEIYEEEKAVEQTEKSSFKSDPLIQNTPLAEDIKKLESKLSKELTEDELFAPLLDFTISPEELPNRKTHARHYNEIINKSLHEKLACIEQFCGMEPEEGKPYFDETDTVAHKMMKRELDILNSLLDSGDLTLSPEEQQQLVNETLVPLLDVNSPQVTEALIGPLSKLPNGPETLLNAVEKFEGDNAKEAFKRLSKSSLDRNSWIDTLIRRLESADAFTAVTIVEGLFDMRLTSSELERIYPPLCRYKEDSSEEHNWLNIRHQMQRIVGDKDFCL
jgi:hypothetical protein